MLAIIATPKRARETSSRDALWELVSKTLAQQEHQNLEVYFAVEVRSQQSDDVAQRSPNVLGARHA